jgi:hypothetical protein
MHDAGAGHLGTGQGEPAGPEIDRPRRLAGRSGRHDRIGLLPRERQAGQSPSIVGQSGQSGGSGDVGGEPATKADFDDGGETLARLSRESPGSKTGSATTATTRSGVGRAPRSMRRTATIDADGLQRLQLCRIAGRRRRGRRR